MTVPGVQSALSVKNAGVEMLTESDKTQAVSGSDQFGTVMQQSMTKQSGINLQRRSSKMPETMPDIRYRLSVTVRM